MIPGNHLTMYRLLELDKNTLNYITLQIISIKNSYLFIDSCYH